jgi:hypothetical protein
VVDLSDPGWHSRADGTTASRHVCKCGINHLGGKCRRLPKSYSSPLLIVSEVISEGCASVNPTLVNCVNERGYIFQSNLSTSWSTQGLQNGIDGAIFSLDTYEEGFLSRVGNGSYGYDTINLGLPGSRLPTLTKQVIAGIWTNDFFIGSLGLSPIPFNFTNLNDPQPSMLGTLRNQSLIPSSSWAYTAGAHYKNPPAFGSLTLGGFDTTRFRRNNLTIAFGADSSRDLLISLQSIKYDTVGSSPLLAKSIDVFIDSLVSEIWLPVDVCEAFAERFNLTWNAQGELYLVESTAHAALLAQNPTFTFTIGQAGGGGETVDIVLPYSAFDLSLTAPIVGDTTQYFPLKQAQNSSQYTLGRTFLQEAYLIADYERLNFSVSQTLFPPTSVQQNLVPILALDQDITSGRKELGKGVIAAIIVVAVVVLALAVIGTLIWLKRRGKQSKTAPSVVSAERPEPQEEPKLGEKATGVHEIDGRDCVYVELPGHPGATRRHELGAETQVHEMGGRESGPYELGSP